MTKWLKYIIDTYWNKHWVTIHKIYRRIHSEVTNTSTHRGLELVINQVNEIYQTRNPRMRAYRNEVWDMFDNFFTEHAIKVVPRSENMIVDSILVTARRFKTPMVGWREHKVHVRNRPSIPDNSKQWIFFEDDEEIKIFLELSDVFANTQIDKENCHLENI